MKQTVLVIPGSAAQVPLVLKAKALGYRVVTINPYDDSPCFAFVDEYRQGDILNRDFTLEAMNELHADVVVSDQCDIATDEVSFLSQKLDKPFIPPDVAALFRDKSRMREFCFEHGINPIPYRLCHDIEEAKSFYLRLGGGKMIIKPIDSNSSRGVFTVEKLSDIDGCFMQAMRWSLRDKAVICEKYIDGTEFTVDGIKLPERGHVCLAISEKQHFEHNRNIASSLYFSHENPMFDYAELKKVNDLYVDSSGLPFGLTHAEYKYEDGKFYLIEIGARGGGNFISSHIVPCMSGIDNMALLIKMSFGDNLVDTNASIRAGLLQRCAILKFFDFNAGKVSGIAGMELLRNNHHILDYKFNFKIGDTIEKPSDDSKRLGYFIAYGDSRTELDRFVMEVDENVKVIYE